MTITTEAAQVYKDREDGIRWNPKKSEIRTLFANVDATKAGTDLANVVPTAVPAIGGINAQVTITDGITGLINVSPYYGNIGFGGGWRTASLSLIDNTYGHAGQTQAAHTFISVTDGSLANGPGNASFAVGALSYKEDWETSLRAGEVDVFYLNSRQGISSDLGGMLNSAQKVFGIGTDVVAYTADGIEDAFATDWAIQVSIPSSVVDWPVAVYVTDGDGKYRVFSGVTLTRDSGTGIGTVTFDTPPDDDAVIEIYQVTNTTLLVGTGAQTVFLTTFPVPAPTTVQTVTGNVIVYVNNVRQTSGFTLSRNATTGIATVTFSVAPTNGHEVRLELGYDGGVTTNEWNAVDLVTLGAGDARQITGATKAVQGVNGMILGFDGKTTYPIGSWIEGRIGKCFAPYFVGLGNTSSGSAGGAPYWEWLFYSETGRANQDEPFTQNQNAGWFGDGTKIRMGPTGNRKHMLVAGNIWAVGNAADDTQLITVNEAGDFRSISTVEAGAGIYKNGAGFAKAFLLANLASFDIYDQVACSDGHLGGECPVYRTTAGWVNMFTGAPLA